MRGLEKKMSVQLEMPSPKAVLHYGAGGVDSLYARVWGDSIHFGLYLCEVDDVEGAVYETKRRMASLAAIDGGTDVLEVAGGWGASARYLARATGARVTSTNLEEGQLETARRLTEIAGLTRLVRHSPADFHALPFEDESFDVWWCQEATVHAHDKPRVFAEAYRVLRPGGRIVFTDQTTEHDKCTDADLERLRQRHGPDDLPSADAFNENLIGAGFSEIDVHDWSRHMGRHFANLVARIERAYPVLTADIDPGIVNFNLALWRFGRELAATGGIGWHCFVAQKKPSM